MVEPRVRAARAVLERAITERVFPAATLDVGSSSGALWRDALGTLRFDVSSAPTIDTPFDLASLTKPISTTSAVMELLVDEALGLDDAVGAYFEEWRGPDREQVTVRNLLEHSSGLPARLVDKPPLGRREFEHEICSIRLEYPARARSLYSDLGFILLGFMVEDRGRTSLATQFEHIWVRQAMRGAGEAIDADTLTFDLPFGRQTEAAPTLPMDEDARRGRTLVGEVHDDYASALGGVAGHAGLFGTAPAVGHFARTVLRASRGDTNLPRPFSPALVGEFTRRGSLPDSSRALGWDTMLLTSSCGTRMSPSAFGHVGFTGTSLWIDPVRDRYFVLLTNRACGGGALESMRAVRRAFHDALGDF